MKWGKNKCIMLIIARPPCLPAVPCVYSFFVLIKMPTAVIQGQRVPSSQCIMPRSAGHKAHELIPGNLIRYLPCIGSIQEKLQRGESLDDSEITFLVMKELECLGTERNSDKDAQEEQAPIQVCI